MTKIEEVEAKVRALEPEELAAFRHWFREFDAELWDAEIEADIEAGKLDDLAEEALAEHRRGLSREI